MYAGRSKVLGKQVRPKQAINQLFNPEMGLLCILIELIS